MKFLFMTGSCLRHLYVASELAQVFPEMEILIEDFHLETGKNYVTEAVTPLMGEHFANFDRTEKEFFSDVVSGRDSLLHERTVRRIAPGAINDPVNVDFIAEREADAVVVYSTSIIRQPLLDAYKNRIVNLHAGLSPYYRGAGTNLFPFLNRELEYVGMTVHWLDAGIDSGDIILQGRPSFDAHEDTHTAGLKCVRLGADLLKQVMHRFGASSEFPRRRQDLSLGRLYLKKHFTDDVLTTIHRQLRDGLVPDYIANPKAVDIVDWTER